ncbi:class I SAM-dependent RNA methyltransferase [Trichloromonas sp.]|uniref:class I SAM-dependent RNA methyltransferase n=1 Tax=Trichloromonas sp. TaxID=3069249 RepID=UPI002A42F0B8|nr:class I SAM-dependent RNA methyltransferase [Trichloromonas sp.]
MIKALLIERLAYGGAGIGRHDGKAIFVPFTAPGDLISCRIVREKKRHAEGELVALREAGPGRCTPPCPVFGLCGGCQWQHLDYAEQARWKEEIFREILVRQAGISAKSVLPLVDAPEAWGYRSRVQFKCRMTEKGFVMGFYRSGSHYVIDVVQCPIAAPAINAALAHFRQWLSAAPCPEKIPQVDMAADDEARVRVVVHVLAGREGALADYLRPLAETVGYALFFQCGRKDSLQLVTGTEDLYIHPEPGSDLRLAYGPGGFAQVNLAQNRRLVAEVLAAFGENPPRRVLDLFCGMGNFSLPLARRVAEVVGVEDYAPSIVKARDNAAKNRVDNVSFHARPAEGAAEFFSREKPFDLVLLDPPRTGAYTVAKELSRLRPPHILYVSCDPPTLARDLVPLLHGGYHLEWSRPFDLFPQTYHTESLTSLRLPV